jgi:hypothetical protein
MHKILFNTKPAMLFYKYIAFILVFYIGVPNQHLFAQNDLALKILRTTPQQTTVGSTVTFKVQLLNEGRMNFGSDYSGTVARIPIQVPAGLSINTTPATAVITTYAGGTYNYATGAYTGGTSGTITGTSGTAAAPGTGTPLTGFYVNTPAATTGQINYSLAAETIKNADVIELELSFTVRDKNNTSGAKNNGEGVHSIKAEITAYATNDIDSSPAGAANVYSTEIEDDVAFSCVTVPLSLCNGGSIDLNANRFYSANSTVATNGVYNIGAVWSSLSNPKVQWKRSTNNGVSYSNIGTNTINDTSLTVTTSGWYSFTMSYDITINGTTTTCTQDVCCPIIINIVPALTATFTPTAICARTPTAIPATITGGTANYDYSWTAPAGLTLTGATTTGSSSTSNSVTATATSPPSSPTVYAVTLTVTDANGCTATDVENITVNPQPTLTMSSNPTICLGSTAVVSTTPSGGSGTYTYSWTPTATITAGSGTSTITVTPTAFGNTVYTVVVADNSGSCTASSSVTVTTNGTPTVTMPTITAKCPSVNTTIDITVSGGTGTYTYAWSNGATTQDITVNPSTTTTYTVTVSNSGANVCSTTRSTTITVNPIPTVTMPTITARCPSVNTTIDITVSGGTGTYTYAWSNGATTQDITVNPSTTTTYTVTVSNSGANVCSTTGSTTITVNPIPTVTMPTITARCPSVNTTIDITVSGGTGTYTYAWSNGATTQDITVNPSTTTTYTVTVSNSGANVCSTTGSTTITVNPIPTVTMPIVSPICASTSTVIDITISGGTGTYTYAWSNGATTQDITVNPATTTTYTVTVSNSGANVCSITGSTTITTNPRPIVNAGADLTICYGGSTTLSAAVSSGTTPYSFSWTPTASITGTSTAATVTTTNLSVTTTFTVIVSDANGCTGSDQVQVTVKAQVTVSNPPSQCKTDNDVTIDLDSRITGEETGGTWSIQSISNYTGYGTSLTTANFPINLANGNGLNTSTGVLNYQGLPPATYVFRYTSGTCTPVDVTVVIDNCCPPQVCLPMSFIRN